MSTDGPKTRLPGSSSSGRALVPSLPRDAWVVLGGDMLSAVGSGLTLPFLLVYLSEVRGIDVAVAGLATATVALVGFVGNPFGGWLIDRLGPRTALACGLVVAATGAFLVCLVREPWHAFAAASVVGLGASMVVPAQDSLLAVVAPVDRRSSVFAVRNATLNAGYALGALGAALIADLTDPRTFVALYVLDGLTFLLFIPVLALLPGRQPPGESSSVTQRGGYRQVLRDRAFVRVWLLFAVLVTIGFAQTISGFPAYAVQSGLTASGIGIAMAANTLTVLVAQLLVLRLMVGHRRTTGIVLACLCWASAWVLVLTGASVDGAVLTVGVFTAALVVFALGETLLAPSQAALVNDLAPDHLRGRYNGLYSLSWTVGLTLGPAASGAFLARGAGDALFTLLTVASLGCGLWAVRLARHLPVGINRVDPV